jgi:hypothetical protein
MWLNRMLSACRERDRTRSARRPSLRAFSRVGYPLSPLLLSVENRWTNNRDGVLSFQQTTLPGGVRMLDTILDLVLAFDAVCFTLLIADEIRWSLSRLRR